MGSVVLPHLRTGWHVDQAILSEEDRLVVIRFGRDHDQDCMRQDEVLYKIADKVKNFAVRLFPPFSPPPNTTCT
jgi:DIM1 family U5 snRNP protein